VAPESGTAGDANVRGASVSMHSGERVATEDATGQAPSDERLVREARAGRQDAFGELVERYQRRAVSVAHRLLGDLQDALEVCQEAFIRAYRSLHTLEDERRFRPWLLRIVTNLSLNWRRDRAVGGPRLSLEDCVLERDRTRDEQLGDGEFSDQRPGAELRADELRRAVQAALRRLSEPQRMALVLFSLEQLPQKEVAAIMKCSVEAVKWHVFQARKRLRDELAEFL